MSDITVQNCFKRAGISKESQMIPKILSKSLMKNLTNLEKGNKITHHQKLTLKS